MLTELAFTPDVFDPARNGNRWEWTEQLRRLMQGILPRGEASPVVISNLYDGAWYTQVLDAVKNMKDPNAREFAKDVVQRLKRLLVTRPPGQEDWPDCEARWAMEAVASSRQEPIGRIVATAGAFEELGGTVAGLRSVGATQEDRFWNGISTLRELAPVPARQQVQALRSLCVHATFIAVASPYIYGGSPGGDEEMDFVAEVIHSAMNRPAHFADPLVDVHTCAPEEDLAGAGGCTRRLENRIANIRSRLAAVCQGKGRIRLFFRTHLRERVLIAGDAEFANGMPVVPRRARWCVSFTHFACSPKESNSDPATWALKPNGTEWYDRLYEKQPGRLAMELPETRTDTQ